MLINFKTCTLNLDNIIDFYGSSDNSLAFYPIKNSFDARYFNFKSKYSRDYNYNRILEMYGLVNVLILEDVDEDEQIIEDFK